jgi:hypothetical protein
MMQFKRVTTSLFSLIVQSTSVQQRYFLEILKSFRHSIKISIFLFGITILASACKDSVDKTIHSKSIQSDQEARIVASETTKKNISISNGSVQPKETKHDVRMSVDRALIHFKRTYTGFAGFALPGIDFRSLLGPIDECVASMGTEAVTNFSGLRDEIKQCATRKGMQVGLNLNPVLDLIQSCVESIGAIDAGIPQLPAFVHSCVENIRSPFQDSIQACVSRKGAQVTGFLLRSNGCAGMPLSVSEAVPVVYFKQHLFDNDRLPFPDHLAYSMINSSEAANYINSEIESRMRYHVAIIDGDLNPGFGKNNEFRNISFYDMCEASGLQGIESVPPALGAGADTHGSKVTGIIMGANNGFGNNGVLRGVHQSTGSKVSFLRTNCLTASSEPDAEFVFTAIEEIIKGTIGDVDVVNMGFGLDSIDRAVFNQYKALFERTLGSDRGTDIVWVTSVGNDGVRKGHDDILPAGLSHTLDNVISVAAYAPSSYERASFSNYGNWISVSAPGVGVYTSTSSESYGSFDGTSAAAALVTGSIGLMFSIDNGLSPSEVKNLITDPEFQKPLSILELPDSIDADKLVRALIPKASAHLAGLADKKSNITSQLRQPGLGSFFFNFKGAGDHELKAIGTQFSQDGSVQMEYRDNEDKSEFWWNVRGTNLPFGTRFGSVGVSCPKEEDDRVCAIRIHHISEANPSEHVIGLTGFHCKFDDGEDHHIKRIGVVVENDNWITAKFGDGSGNPWTCKVDYAILRKGRVKETIVKSGTAEGLDTIPVLDFPDIIQSFLLRYKGDDHRVDRVSIESEPGGIKVRLNDAGGEDKFHWRLSYHILR